MNSKERVFEIVAQIPKGKVTTYKYLAIASDIGPRVVGNYLHKNKDPKIYPCHRVVHSDGTLAGGFAFGGKDRQLQLLRSEGVKFRNDKVDLKEFGWELT